MKIEILYGNLGYISIDVDQFLKVYTIEEVYGYDRYPIKEIFNLTLLKEIILPNCYFTLRLCNLVNLEQLNLTASSKIKVRILDKKKYYANI